MPRESKQPTGLLKHNRNTRCYRFLINNRCINKLSASHSRHHTLHIRWKLYIMCYFALISLLYRTATELRQLCQRAGLYTRLRKRRFKTSEYIACTWNRNRTTSETINYHNSIIFSHYKNIYLTTILLYTILYNWVKKLQNISTKIPYINACKIYSGLLVNYTWSIKYILHDLQD